MPRKPARSGTAWTSAEVRQLRQELRQNTPTRVVGIKHARTSGAIQQKANDLGLSTKPTNRSPYGSSRRKRRG
jgi:hypothetical protein